MAEIRPVTVYWLGTSYFKSTVLCSFFSDGSDTGSSNS